MGRQSCTFGGSITPTIYAIATNVISGSVALTTTTAPACSFGGTVTVDASVATGFLAPTLGGLTSDRIVGARVLIDGEEMTGLTGQVVIRETLDDPIQTAEFELSDPRVARYSDTTVAWGDSDCEIYLKSGSPGNVQEFRAFKGTISGPANTGNTRVQGRFQAVGAAAAWVGRPACITGPAFAGKHRGQLVREALASAGATVTNPEIDVMGAEVQRPYELMGPVVPYLQKVCELEGWRVRTNTDGSVELIDEDDVLTGPVIYAFDESNYDTCEEEPANAPVLVWVFNGSILATDGTGDGAAQLPAGQRTVVLPLAVSADGSYSRVEITMDKSTELFRRQTDYQVVQADGIALGPGVLQPVSKTEIQSRYPRLDSSSGDYNYSTRLDWRKVQRWALTGTRCSTDTGNLWQSGDQYLETSARLTLVEEIEETYEFDSVTCTLKTETVTRKELFAPTCDPATGGAYIYADGSASMAQQYSMQVTGASVKHWSDYRNANVGSLPTVIAQRSTSRWIPVARAADGTNVIEAYRPAENVREEWVGDASQTRWTKTTTVSFPPGIIRTVDGSLPPVGTTTENGVGPVPGPPSGSSDVPQYAQQVFVWTVDRSDQYPFTPLSRAETLELAESTAEADGVGARRIGHAVGTVERIKGQTIPGLRVGDHVTVVCNARNIVAPKGGLVLQTEQAHGVDVPTAQQLTFVWLPYEEAT